MESPLGRVFHKCFEKLGSLIRSQARYGTSWKRATTAEISVCWRRTAWGSRKALAPPRTSGRNAKKLNCTGRPYLRAVIKIGLERAQSAFVGLTVFVAELVPAGPPSGANHVESGIVNLGKILIPDIHVGMLEEEALDFARHVRCTDDGERMAVDFEVVVVDAQVRAGAEIGFVADPEGGMVDRADAVAFEQLRFDDVEALAFGRRQHDGIAWVSRLRSSGSWAAPRGMS